MDGNYLKADSKHILKKCDRNSNDGVDRISKLPDEIIVYILSLLSLREAVCTSVLSPRWRDLWARIPTLNLYSPPLYNGERFWDPEKCKYIKMVNSVLQLHKAPFLKEFKISVFVTKAAQSTVTKWLDFVFSRRVESLELDFRCEEDSMSDHMADLEESLRESVACRDQTLPAFTSLKRLCLQQLKVSGEVIEFFLRNCALLEQLSIEGADLTSDIVVSGTTLGLTHLDIKDCCGENSVRVSAPKLTWLNTDTEPENLFIENVPRLSGASFKCRGLSLDEVQHFASKAFCCISQLKLLELNTPYPKVFLSILFPFPRMPNLEKLVFMCRGAYGHGLLPLTGLIWAAPRLQEFKLEFINVPRDPHAWREGITNGYGERHPHRHLKVFEFIGFCCRARDHMELLTYILNHCVTLEKIIIDCLPIFIEFEANPFPKIQPAQARTKKKLEGIVPDHIQLCIL